MQNGNINGIEFVVENGEMEISEVEYYINEIQSKTSNKLKSLNIIIDGDDVDIRYEFDTAQFERIRRITGYLVGTTDRWNDAKQAELRDRVKHTSTKF